MFALTWVALYCTIYSFAIPYRSHFFASWTSETKELTVTPARHRFHKTALETYSEDKNKLNLMEDTIHAPGTASTEGVRRD